METPAFELLHPKVQQVVAALGWTSLHPVQEQAIRCFSEGAYDIIVSAPTSGGKTEAAFLPVLSALVDKPTNSVQALCISPLKALINDQHARVTNLCKDLGIAVNRWHGDVPVDSKRRLRRVPSGILFITPESLESGFINYSHEIVKLYGKLQYVVIDELHAMLDTERGVHVRSLLARLMAAIGRRPRFFALSATLGNPLAAKFFLNQDNPDSVQVITDDSTTRPLAVQVISVVEDSVSEAVSTRSKSKSGTLGVIANDLSDVFNEGSYLVFANSRRTVEELGDHFRGDSELAGDGQAAVALHHGSLSARVRRRTELMLKSGVSTRALCTSSLELGIDIGAVEAVGQIDPPSSVASMVQRLGRSGRTTGSKRKLRLYIRTAPPNTDASLDELLYPSLLQGIAMVRLVFQGWLESPNGDGMHLSTLLHQVLSVLKETGGRTAVQLYDALCRLGPFRRVEPRHFKQLLQGMFKHNLIDQDSDGLLFLGMAGEKITSAPGFYAAFSTPVELTVRCGATELGRVPATAMLKVGECLLLNGRRWLVDGIEWKAKSVWVSPTAAKKPTVFLGGVGETHDRIFQEMRELLLSTEIPEWIDAHSQELLQSARETASKVGLLDNDVIELDDAVQWFPWAGTRTMRTIQLWAQQADLGFDKNHLSFTFDGLSRGEFEQHLVLLAESEVDALKLATLMPKKQIERFDCYVDERLLDQANSESRVDLAGAREAARRTLKKSIPDRWPGTAERPVA